MTDSDPPDDIYHDVVEPGSPAPENALFVALGALSTIAIVLRLAGVL